MYVIFGKGKTGTWLKLLLDKLGIENLVMDDSDIDLSVLDTAEKIVKSPGIPQSHVIYSTYKEKIESELNFVWSVINDLDLRKNIDFLGVTWTNGKSSSVWILYNIFKNLDTWKHVWLSGNFDIPLSQTVFEILDKKLENEKHIVVMECSSFMLHELNNIQFEYSVRLNLSIDHLNRHKDLQEYFDTKKLLLDHTKWIGFVDHDLYEKLKDGKMKVEIRMFDDGYDIKKTRFIGKHNAGNINACYLLSKAYLKDITSWNEQEIETKLKAVIAMIDPLPHHTTLLKTIDGIKIYDDAKCTSSLALGAALRCFDEKIVLICGWFDKWGDDFQELKPEFESVVEYCAIIWQTAHYFKAICEEKEISYKIYDTLQEAMQDSLQKAKEKNLNYILFSPGCASFDMFKNFEERAKVFVEIVNSL